MNRKQLILEKFSTQDVVVCRDFYLCGQSGVILYNPDLTNSNTILHLIGALESAKHKIKSADDLLKSFVIVGEAKTESSIDGAIDGILSGDCVVIVDKIKLMVVVNSRQYEKRAVTEPPTSNVMQGPREGFTEDLKTNLSLLEKRIKSEKLSIKRMKVGRYSNTNVALIFIDGVADEKIVNEICTRLGKINIDGIIDSNVIRAFLEDRPYSIFSQVGITEKPDVACGKILEGRIAIVVDGTPIVLTLPFMLVEDYQSGEDYYQRSGFASFLRFIRFLGVFTAVFLPGLYVALQVFHFNIIPMRFILTLMSSVNDIPFKPLSETMFVIFLFELIREAGVRTPRAVGMAMSIVGALVLGETAVKAGIISSPAVMIVALSSLSLYIVPNQVGTMSILRIIFTIIGGAGGLYLIMAGALYLVMYLVSLDSYDTPYLAPFAPIIKEDLKDSFIKVSVLRMKTRPKSLPGSNKRRQK